jgi:hypothetical protein
MSENLNIDIKPVKNVKGKIISKEITIKPKKKKQVLNIETVNNIYMNFKNDYPDKDFMIKAMSYDGFKTLKSFSYNEDTLKYIEYNEYYSSMSKEAQDIFTNVFFIQIITKEK